MTLHCAVFGTVFRDVEIKESKAGSTYATCLALVPNGADETGRDITIFMRIMAFKDNVERLAQVKDQDKIYAEGRLSPKIYEAEGKPPRLDLTLLATFVRKTQIGQNQPPREKEPAKRETFPDYKPAPEAGHYSNALTGQSEFGDMPMMRKPPTDIPRHSRERPKVQGLNDDFDDRMPF